MSYSRWSENGVYIYWESSTSPDNKKDDQVLRVIFALTSDAKITYGEITKLGLEDSTMLCYDRAGYEWSEDEANVVRTSILAFLHDVEVAFRYEPANNVNEIVTVGKFGNTFVCAVVMLVGVAITIYTCITAILKHTRAKWARRQTL